MELTLTLATPRQRSLMLAVTCVLLAGVSLFLNLLPFKFEMALTMVFVLTIIAWSVRRKLRGEFDWFELFQLFAILNFAYFGMGSLWLLARPEMLFSTSLSAYITPALVLAVTGFLSATAGYITLGGRTPPAPIGTFVPVRSKFYVIVAFVGFAGELGAVAQERFVALTRSGFSPFFSTIQQFAPLFLYTWALLWMQFWAKALTRGQKLFLFLGVVPMAFVGLVGLLGAKEHAIIVMIYPAIAYWYARRRMPWRAFAAFALIGVFVIFPVYNTFRNQSLKLETDQRMSRTFDAAIRWDRREFMDHSATAFMQRMSLVYCVGAILRDVPEAVPYRYGETLALLPIGLLIPRILWHDKPNITIGREFGVTFQLVNPVDKVTQISPTITGELYWNYDLPGVIIGMFLIGGAMRVFYERYGSGVQLQPLRRASYLALLPFAIHFEGNVAGMMGGLIKCSLILGLFFMASRHFGWIVPGAARSGSSAGA